MKNKLGVSLAELLAVVVIMGIIAAIAVPLVGRLIEDTKKDSLKGDAYAIADAARLYCLQNSDKTGCSDHEAFNFFQNSDGNYNNIVYHQPQYYKSTDAVFSKDITTGALTTGAYYNIANSTEVSQYLSKEFTHADYYYSLTYVQGVELGPFVRIYQKGTEYMYAGYPLSDGTEVLFECASIAGEPDKQTVNGIDIWHNCHMK